MKRSTKQLLSLLLAIVMVCGLMAPALAARPMGGDVAETPVTDVSGAKLSGVSRPAVKSTDQAELLAAGDKKSMDVATMTAFAAGAKADGDTEVVDGFFTVHYGAKDKLEGNSKSFNDGYSGTQRLNFGAYSDFTKSSDYIEFTTTNPMVVKIWWVANKEIRATNIYKSTDTTTPVWTSGQPNTSSSTPLMSSAYLADAGTYYIGFPSAVPDVPVVAGQTAGGNYIFKVEAIEVEQEPTVTEIEWANVGTLTATAAGAVDAESNPIDGKADVTVSGVVIGDTVDATTQNVTRGAEKVTVELLKDGASTTPATTKVITKWGAVDASNKVTFDLPGTGEYTFKATATRGQETPKEATTTPAISYVLPLAKPLLAAKEGDGKVTLSWNAVKEATSYEVYQGETKLTGTPTLADGKYTLEVTGLTNGTTYTFTVKALRTTPAADATSEAATATPSAGGNTATKTYTLDVGKDLPDIGKGVLTQGNSQKGGTENYFTVTGGTKIQVAAGTKTFSDEYVATKRLRPGTTHDATTTDLTSDNHWTNNSVKITTEGPAKVKIWWYGDSTAADQTVRYVGIWNAQGQEVAATPTAATAGAAMIAENLAIDVPGTYYFTNPKNGCTISKIEVTETLPINTYEYTLDVSNAQHLTAFAKGELGQGATKAAGTDGYFTITGGTKIQAASGNKTYTDTDEAYNLSATVRLRPGTTHDATTTDLTSDNHWTNNSVMIKTDGAAKVDIWWYGDSTAADQTVRYVGIWDAEGNEVAATPTASTAGAAMIAKGLDIPKAGTYYFTNPKNGCTISKIHVVETVVGTKKTPKLADWATVSDNAAISGTAAADTLTAQVTGILVGEGPVEGSTYPVYADGIEVKLYKDSVAEANLIDSKVSNKAMDATSKTQDVTFKPSASGSYVLELTITRAEDSKSKSVVSAPVVFSLPLGKAVVSSVASNGLETGKETASANVMWAKVPEATAYNVQFKEHDATEWSAVQKVDAPSVTYVATGLTVGKTYDFKVQALRDTEEGAWSEVFTSEAITAKQQIAWVEKVFGTSTTNIYNRVISPETQLYKRNEAAKKDEKVDVYTADGGETVTVNDNGDYTITLKNQEPRTIAGLTGDLNTDPEGRVLLSSHEGAGKIKENEGADGQLFYYTAIPAGTNYTLTADVEVLRWITRDTQNGVGLAVMDRVADKSWTGSVSGNADNFWNNVYYVGAMRGSFSHDVKTGTTYSNKDAGYGTGTNYSYYMGPFATTKIGIPMTANGPYNATSGPKTYYERRFPLDTRLAKDGRTAKFESTSNRFNLIGNYTVAPKGFSQMSENGAWMSQYEMTKFKLQIQKNNTGYISTVWDATGTQMLGQNIEYYVKGAMELSGDKPYHDNDTSGRKDIAELKCLDSDFEYVGLFTSRDMDALFTNVKLTTIPASEDAPEEEPPMTTLTPSMSISSGANSNSESFTLSVTANVEGSVTVKQNGVALPDTYAIKYDEDGNTVRLDVPVTLREGGNSFEVTFTPDPDQELPPFTKISSFDPITKKSTVSYNPNYKYLQNIYVAPNGRSNNYGTKSRPLDIYTAVSVVSPGQNIILKEGVYNLTKSINIGKGMSGTDGTVTLQIADLDENGEPKLDENGEVITKDYVKDATIVMLADVDENGDPVKVVLNGQRKTGVLSLAASYWVLKDFEVAGSTGTGVAISGSYNVAQNLKLHDNLSTGLQISAGANDRPPVREGEDRIDGDLAITDWGEWPCYNKVINCDSYRNYDNGYGGADGFGAKERVGCGNVFDGCVAYWNADDGWDMYAKTEPDKGPLGRITVKNSITFENGYEVRVLKDGVVQYEADGYNAKMNYDADGKIVKDPAGNGNGFKMGGSHLPGAHSITNSFAFYNKVKGFDSNNGPDIKVSGCTAYNNGEENVGLGTKFNAANYLVEKTVSFKDDKMTGDKMKDALVEGTDSTITVNTSKYDEETYYKWDGTKSANKKGAEITAANFVSLDFDNTAWVDGAVRDANGALNLGDFLKLTGVTDTGAVEDKVDPETPVETPDNVINPPEEGPKGGNSGGSGGGIPGTIGDLTDKADKPDDTKPTFKAEKTTDKDGNTEIVVKNNDGETVADVKIPAEIPASDVKFDDAIGHWAEDSIDNMAALGVVNGVGGNRYGVDEDVTRGALATMLFRFANGKEGISNTFADVAADQWYTDAIGWAVMTGVVTGYNAEEFGPNDQITREQMAVMLTRFAKLVGLDTTASSGELAGFKDVSGVSSWAVDGMAWCVKNGIIKGVSADSLSPDTYATRAQTAVMLDRFIQLMK